MSDPTSPPLNSQCHTCTSINRVLQHTRSVQEERRTYSHPFQRPERAKAPWESECACVLLRRMRRNPRMLRCSHRRSTGGLRKATPPRPASPRPCRLEALLPAVWFSLPFPTGWRLSLAFLSLCSRTSRDSSRNPWPGLRG